MKGSKLLLTLVLVLTSTISFVSCDRSQAPVYEKFLKIKNTSWDRFDIKQFEIPIGEKDMNIDITLAVRCTEQLKYDKIPFYVILTNPTGEESIREISVPVREGGKLVTELKGTKPDSRIVLWKNLKVAANSNCKISIENMIPKIQTVGIEAVGIIVSKTI